MEGSIRKSSRLRKKLLKSNYYCHKRKPIRPRSPFFFFKHVERDRIILYHRSIPNTMLNHIIKNKWTELDDAEMNIFIEMAALDRARYEQEMSEYRKFSNQSTRSTKSWTPNYLTDEDMSIARAKYKSILNNFDDSIVLD